MGRIADSYCRYHRTDNYTTDNYRTLKQQTKQLILKNHLKKLVKGAKREAAENRRHGNNSRN